MILDEQEVKERFESPLNLLNRLKSQLSSSKSSTSFPSSSQNLSEKASIVSLPPTSDQIVEGLEEKLKFGSLKNKAADIMHDCLTALKGKVEEIDKPEKLASIAETMNKVITAENKNKSDEKNNMPQVVYYCPTFIKEEYFDTIQVRE